MTTPNTQTTTAIAKPQPTPWMLAGNKGFGVSTENLDDTLADYTAEQRDVLLWWIETAKDRGWNISTLKEHTGVSTATLSRIYRGVYNADVSKVVGRLKLARERFGEVVENPDFIMTSLARRMYAIFDKVRALRTVALVWGPKGIGKTTIEEEYTRTHNHGSTYYFRVPGYGVTRNQFIAALAASMRIATKPNAEEMREKIGQYLARGNRLLILDEFHEIFRTCDPRHIVRICEWVRQLYDSHNIGLAITGTELVEHEFFQGKFSDVLDQLVDRGTLQIALRGKPTKKDVLAFLKHYGLPFPVADTAELQLLNDILAASGLRKLTLHLRDGAVYANKLGERYTWDHFSAAHEAIQTLSA